MSNTDWTLKNPFIAVFTASRSWPRSLFWIAIFYIFLTSIAIFFFWIDPSLADNSHFRIGPDSSFYLWRAGLIEHNPYEGDLLGLLTLDSNFLGPYLIASTLRVNFLIFLLNVLLFGIAIRCFAKAERLNLPLFLTLLLLNPVVYVAILTLGKEILAILTTSLVCYWASKRSVRIIPALLLISFLSRWESAVATGIFILLSAKRGWTSRHRKATLALLLLIISIALPFFTFLSKLTVVSEASGGKTIAVLTGWQTNGFYFLAFIPKLALNLFGGIKTVFSPTSDSHDIYNTFVAPLGSLFNIVIVAWYFVKRRARFSLSNDRLFFCAVYCVLFVIGPTAQIRFWLPIYLILCFELARIGRVTENLLDANMRVQRKPAEGTAGG